MAPEVGLEPTTHRLTADCSTIELLWIPKAAQSTKHRPQRQTDSKPGWVLLGFACATQEICGLMAQHGVDTKTSQPLTGEICILAGGLSRRMGRDKSRLKLGRHTMLGHIRAEAKSLGWPVRVVRRDAVPRCGPLGGIFTALRSTRAQCVLFLACDMPWVSARLMRSVLRRCRLTGLAVFVRSRSSAGFPVALRREALAIVARQIANHEFSLQALARALRARTLQPSARLRAQLRNVNTPDEWKRVCCEWTAS